jgi:prepilin-type N-terminal cleavage/methylation domain-containing protein
MNSRALGFTLVEILVTSSIFGLLASLSLVAFVSYSKKEALDSNAHVLASTLRDARSKTLSSVGGSRYGVHIDSETFTFFQGSTFSPLSSTNKQYRLSAFVRATSTVPTVVFDRVTGNNASPSVITLYLASDSSIKKSITVQGTGVVSAD